MPYQRVEKPEPMAVPMEVEPEEETKLPTVAEARAMFDATDAAPPKKVSKMEFKPAGPAKVPVAAPPKPVPEVIPRKVVPPAQEVPERTTKKSPSPRCNRNLLHADL